MKRATFACILAILVCLGGATAVAQSTTPTGTWTFTGFGLYAYWLDGFIPSGASIDILYAGVKLIPGLDTIIEDDPGAGWQSNDFYLNPDGSHYTGPYTGGNTSPSYTQTGFVNVLGPTSGGNSPTTYDQAEFLNDLGIRQGILWNPEQKRNLLEGFLFYRVHYDYNSVATEWGQQRTLLNDSPFPDKTQIFSNALLAGLSLNTVGVDPVHKTEQGLYGEASVEWGPSFFLNSIGGSDYYRLNATLKAYQTLFARSTSADPDMNLVSAYLADYVGVDYAGGDSVPVFVFESFGGRYMRAGNGTTIHGLDDGNYATGLKLINNLELRVVGPAIVWRDLAPAMFAFLDTAYYNGYFQAPSNPAIGFLGSTGVGIYVNVFDLADLNLYFAYPFSGTRINGASYSIGAAFNLAF